MDNTPHYDSFAALADDSIFSLSEMARYFGMSLRTTQHWYTGYNAPKQYIIDLIAYHLTAEGYMKDSDISRNIKSK